MMRFAASLLQRKPFTLSKAATRPYFFERYRSFPLAPRIYAKCLSLSSATGVGRNSNYTIANVSSAAQLSEIINQFVLPEGWMPALDDHTLYYHTDPTGFYVGELDGKPISLFSAVKYGNDLAFLGLYILLKEYRGHGYGLKLFEEVLNPLLSSSYNVGLDGVQSMVAMYRPWGFSDACISSRAQLNITTALKKLESFTPPPNVVIQPASAVDFNKLSAYDNEVFGAPHQLFLKGLLDGPNTITKVATNQNGDIVGFVAARKTITLKEGWKLTPLYADDGKIARTILRAVLKEMRSCEPEREVAMLLWASDTNPDSMVLSKEVGAVLLGDDMIRMFSKGPLNTPKEKLYSYSSAELG